MGHVSRKIAGRSCLAHLLILAGSTLRSGPLRPGPRTCKCGSGPPSQRTEPRTCRFGSVRTSVRIGLDRTMDSVRVTYTHERRYGFHADTGTGEGKITHGLPVTNPTNFEANILQFNF